MLVLLTAALLQKHDGVKFPLKSLCFLMCLLQLGHLLSQILSVMGWRGLAWLPLIQPFNTEVLLEWTKRTDKISLQTKGELKKEGQDDRD